MNCDRIHPAHASILPCQRGHRQRLTHLGSFKLLVNSGNGGLDYLLKVHGMRGQARAFIHIQNTVRCVELDVDNPPAKGERVKIVNQMTEFESDDGDSLGE